jgi:hypothetical protein
MSQIQPNIQLDYNVPVTFKRSSNGKVLLIQGTAIDDTVNENSWQVPAEELPYFVAVSQNVQIRVDHGDRVEDIKGVIKILKDPKVAADGRLEVPFEGELSGDEELLTKIEKEYVNSVSPRVVGEAFCSACGNRSRDSQMNLVHICRGAWEVMRSPRLIELSIVSRGAYEHAKLRPVGFAAAMKKNQQNQVNAVLAAKGKSLCVKCASAPNLGCLNCSSEVLPFKGNNQILGEKKKMSASTNPTIDAEAVKAMIDQHAKNLAEACKQTAEACKTEAEAAVKKAVEAAREAAKTENAANLAKIESMITAALSKRAPGKGAVGSLDENKEPPKLQLGMVAVPPYFRELAAAAKKKRSFDAQFGQTGAQ